MRGNIKRSPISGRSANTLPPTDRSKVAVYPFLNGYGAAAPITWHKGRAIMPDEFVEVVAAFRTRLPATRYIVNLCQDRFAFLVTFAAALADRRITLLPPDAGDAALHGLRDRYDAVAVVTDQSVTSLPVPAVSFSSTSKPGGRVEELTAIPADQPAVVVHTSGSTGAPQPHIKTWGSLVRRARAVGTRLTLDTARISKTVATVPSQHMYGIENAVMLPLRHGMAIHPGRPLFPADVAAAVDAATLLVTTPIHLRSLLTAEFGARAGLILSSTAPLSRERARRAEEVLGASAIEIYGSTETGVVATRRPSLEADWRALDSVRLEPGPDAVLFRDEAGTVTPLHDALEVFDDGRFRLRERTRDVVKVAGKRASLAGLNHSLCAVEGVEDGAFLVPRNQDRAAARLVAFVVAPSVSEDRIISRLRERVDPAFLPRPLVKVKALPRNAVGKLPLDELHELWSDAG